MFLKKSDLRRVMCTAAAAVLLLALCCAAPAAAVAPSPDAVQFNGGTFATAADLAAALGNGNASASDDTLTLLRNINVTGTITITGSMTILGNDHFIWRSSTSGFLINVTAGTLTLGDGTSKLTTDCPG